MCTLFQLDNGERINVLSQAVKELVVTLLDNASDKTLKSVVQVLKVRTLCILLIKLLTGTQF